MVTRNKGRAALMRSDPHNRGFVLYAGRGEFSGQWRWFRYTGHSLSVAMECDPEESTNAATASKDQPPTVIWGGHQIYLP